MERKNSISTNITIVALGDPFGLGFTVVSTLVTLQNGHIVYGDVAHVATPSYTLDYNLRRRKWETVKKMKSTIVSYRVFRCFTWKPFLALGKLKMPCSHWFPWFPSLLNINRGRRSFSCLKYMFRAPTVAPNIWYLQFCCFFFCFKIKNAYSLQILMEKKK